MSKTPSHKKQSKTLKKKRKDKQRLKKINKQKDAEKLFQKEVSKQLEIVENFVSNMPKTCADCDKEFDPSSDDHLDNWNLTISESGTSLICNDCGEKDE